MLHHLRGRYECRRVQDGRSRPAIGAKVTRSGVSPNFIHTSVFGASFQIMSIVVGAVAPPFMGWLAETYHSMAICFILPLIGFIATTIYGFVYPRLLAMSARAA